MGSSSFGLRLAPAVVAIASLLAGCSLHRTTQIGDVAWQPVVDNPEFQRGVGPRVVVDSAHGNWHTIDGRFAAFGRLLRADGYEVRDLPDALSSGSLEGADLLVIANPIHGGEEAEWVAPTPSAFTAEEVEAVESWVRGGGSLLLIADHMPFPGAAAGLAAAFGVEFLNGFALRAGEGGGTRSFVFDDGTLVDHEIASGRNASERVASVKTFTGQAFRPGPTTPLLEMPADWELLLPEEAWEFDDDTRRISTEGLVQAGVLEHGAGRVAFFGEAAMFTAQAVTRDGTTYRIGLNDPEAPDNAQFVLNVVHWLTGRFDGS